MPLCPSRPFLLWHEAAVTGRWRKLLDAPATPDRLVALWLLQIYALHPARAEDVDARARAAIAAGWGN